MNIKITYKCKNNILTTSFELTTQQYYETIEEGENYEDDCIPKYDQTIDYIIDFDSTVTEELLEYSILKIQDSIKSNKNITTTYFGNKSQLIHSISDTGWELIIQSIRIAENCIAITRMERADSKSSWTNISYSTGLNYENNQSGKEIWYSANEGEYIRKNITLD